MSPGALGHDDIVDLYFMENRARLLDLAAFLDRLDRADAREATGGATGGATGEATRGRMVAFRKALAILGSGRPDRAVAIQMVLSDTRMEPRERADRKSAVGAPDPEEG